MTKNTPEPVSHFTTKAADKLAVAVINLVRSGVLDARCVAADAALDYASIRFGDRNPIGDLLSHMEDQPPR